jgi:hypothetical protein
VAKRAAKLGPPTSDEMLEVIKETGQALEKATNAVNKAKESLRSKRGVMDELKEKLTKLSLQLEDPALFNQAEPDPEEEDDFEDE